MSGADDARTLAARAAWGRSTPSTPAEWDAAVKRFLTTYQADQSDADGPVDPPFVLRIATRDGSKTLGLMRNSDCQDMNVSDTADLVRRLNEATAEILATLRVMWRQGGTDTWVELSHPGWQSWECPKCGGKLSTNTTQPDQVLRILAVHGPHSHVGLAARWDEIEATILEAYEAIGSGPGSLVSLAEIRTFLGERYPRPGVDEALVRLDQDDRKAGHLFPIEGRALTQADLDSALMLGGEWQHQLMIEEASR